MLRIAQNKNRKPETACGYYKTFFEILMKRIDIYFNQYENICNDLDFTKCGHFWHHFYALAKSSASRGKLNLSQANVSTPILDCAFFVRNIRTPHGKANLCQFIQDRINLLNFQQIKFIQNRINFPNFREIKFLSMVERNGQSLLTGCFPVMTVFHPVTFYRPTVESKAVVLEILITGLSPMIYKFLCVNRTQSQFNLCLQTTQGNTEEQARLALSADFQCLGVVARINPTHKKDRLEDEKLIDRKADDFDFKRYQNTPKNDHTSNHQGGFYA